MVAIFDLIFFNFKKAITRPGVEFPLSELLFTKGLGVPILTAYLV